MPTYLCAHIACAGAKYLDWLAAARSALSVGMAHFIERDFDGWADFLGLWRLAPLLGSINVVELLAPHSSQLSRRFK